MLIMLLFISMSVDGGWSSWSSWGSCTTTCDLGTTVRTRQCNNPIPGSHGRNCSGTFVEEKPCNNGRCTGTVLKMNRRYTYFGNKKDTANEKNTHQHVCLTF